MRAFGIFLALTASTALAQSQITTGVIQGTVVDPQGALVQGANIEATSVDTNQTRALATGADGRFVFLQLTSGRYVLSVKKAGFATVVQENLVLTVGQAINLNLKLKVSSIDETVTVTATSTVDTSRTEKSTTLNETTISTTPVLGRKFEDLLTLTPGVSVVQGPDGDEITFAGQRGVFNNISLDGGDYNNGFFGEQMGSERRSISLSRPSRSFRWWRAAPMPSSGAPRAGSSTSSPSPGRTTSREAFFTSSGSKA
ncbi:MAG: carboxypeptidase regulatory-like domain-containing protein [Vicinamibacteria bacterium]|nr:carboxypeptidase regulatory-like domain-containing protein [Vicinamibacteria bacterium]